MKRIKASQVNESPVEIPIGGGMFNYTRTILPLPNVTVPRIILPLRLERHTVYIFSLADVDHTEMKFCAGKHYLTGAGICYVKRVHQGKPINN